MHFKCYRQGWRTSLKLSEAGGAFFSILKNEVQAVRSALWFRPAVFCLAAILLALLVAGIDDLLPRAALSWLPEVETSSLRDLLNLLATGMLTVSTVTLSVLMLVLSLTAGQASPRAVPEVMADPVTQNALGSFLGTFVFSLTALMLLGSDSISESGVAITFFCALALIMNAVRYLVQWIHHVAESLKLNRIVKRIHSQAERVLENYLEQDAAQGCPAAPGKGRETAVQANRSGFVQLVDGAELRGLAERHEMTIRLCVREGDFVHPRRVLMVLRGAELNEDLETALRLSVAVHFERSPENDPLLGFELLAEVACRALSPGVNDPQSALVSLEYLAALLSQAAVRPAADYPPPCIGDGRVVLKRVAFTAFVEQALRPVMRDGAGSVEVICKIVELLAELVGICAPEYLELLTAEAERAEAFGKEALILPQDKTALAEAVAALRRAASSRAAS